MKTLMLDIDGVLAIDEIFSKQYIRQKGLDADSMDEFFSGVFLDCLIGKKDVKEAVEPYLSAWKWNRTPAEFLDNWFNLQSALNQELIDFVTDLRENGTRVILATNQEKYRASYMKKKLNGCFDIFFCSGELGHLKPELDFYSKVLDYLDSKPESIIFFDDCEKNVEGAIDAGIDGQLFIDNASTIKKILKWIG